MAMAIAGFGGRRRTRQIARTVPPGTRSGCGHGRAGLAAAVVGQSQRRTAFHTGRWLDIAAVRQTLPGRSSSRFFLLALLMMLAQSKHHGGYLLLLLFYLLVWVVVRVW